MLIAPVFKDGKAVSYGTRSLILVLIPFFAFKRALYLSSKWHTNFIKTFTKIACIFNKFFKIENVKNPVKIITFFDFYVISYNLMSD